MSETKRRITVEEVQEAYRKTGLKPGRGVFNDGCGQGCPVGALALQAGVNSIDWGHANLSGYYASGFFHAWDGTKTPAYFETCETYQLGYQDGLAVAAAIFGEPSHD